MGDGRLRTTALSPEVPLGAGWDTDAVLVDGAWVERTARRRDVEPWLRTETRLLPWLAPQLPLPVPMPRVVAEDPLITRHRLVPGAPLRVPSVADGRALGRFLRALHGVDLDAAVARGVPAAARTRRMRDAAFARFHDEVVGDLPAACRGPARALLARLADAPAAVLVHGDLTDDHLLASAGRLDGVIDWSDARAGDPAKDLAWALSAASPAFADAVAVAYGADRGLRARARDWWRVGPCYTVLHGRDTGDDGLVSEGLAALASALGPAASPRPASPRPAAPDARPAST